MIPTTDGNAYVLTDLDHDELRVEPLERPDEPQALSLLAVRRDAHGGGEVGVHLDRDAVLDLYHLLGEWLMSTRDREDAEPVDPTINAGIKAALGQLNGTDAAAVSMMTGLSAEELDDLGGLPQYCDRTDHLTSSCGHDGPTVLEDAQNAVYGDRGADYGHPRDHWTRTAIIWTGILQHKLADGEHLEPEDVGRLYIGDKLSRDVHSAKRDNRVDIAGYALCLDRLETGR